YRGDVESFRPTVPYVPTRSDVLYNPKHEGFDEARLVPAGGEDRNHTGRVVGMDELKDAVAPPVALGVPEHTCRRRARVADAALGVEHGDDVGAVLDQGPPACFADAQRLFGLVAAGRGDGHS